MIGWNGGGGRSVVSVSAQRAPDAEWFGAPPRLVTDVRGAAAETIIRKLPQAVAAYPYATSVQRVAGSQQQHVLAHLGREIAELHVTLPSTAIGKDYLPIDRIIATTPSGSGVQLSLFGILGVLSGPTRASNSTCWAW